MCKSKVLLVVLTALCSLLPALLYAQVDTAWVRRYNDSGNDDDIARAIAVDGQGNVYVTGYSWSSGTSYDYATIKYNSAGVQQWVARYDGPANSEDAAYAIALDGQGNVYVTGYSYGSGTLSDYATIKYNSAGVEQWVARYNGPGNSSDYARAIAVDGFGNVYVTGESCASGTNWDYVTIKYNSAGVQQWVARYNGPANSDDCAYAIAVDGFGNVYVTGTSIGSGTSYDYATIKYNSVGVEQWVARYNGPANSYDLPCAIAVDSSENVYVTGYSEGSGTSDDYATIKYVQTVPVEENEIARVRDGQRNDFVVYPNPARNYFAIRLTQDMLNPNIKICDVTGKEVKEFKSFGNGELRVSFNGIKNGICFVKVNDVMVKEKLVVTR